MSDNVRGFLFFVSFLSTIIVLLLLFEKYIRFLGNVRSFLFFVPRAFFFVPTVIVVLLTLVVTWRILVSSTCVENKDLGTLLNFLNARLTYQMMLTWCTVTRTGGPGRTSRPCFRDHQQREQQKKNDCASTTADKCKIGEPAGGRG